MHEWDYTRVSTVFENALNVLKANLPCFKSFKGHFKFIFQAYHTGTLSKLSHDYISIRIVFCQFMGFYHKRYWHVGYGSIAKKPEAQLLPLQAQLPY